MKHLLLIIVFLTTLGMLAGLSTWDGSDNRNWNDPDNWTPYGVPTTTTDVDINYSAATQYPIINAAAYCQNLYLEDGVPLTFNSTYSLNVSASAYLNGALVMSGTGDLIVSGNVEWGPGGSANVSNASAYIDVNGNMTFFSSSNVQLTNGQIRFRGAAATSTLTNESTNTQLYVLSNAKTSGTLEIANTISSKPFTVNSQIINSANNKFYNNYVGAVTVKGYGIVDYNSTDNSGTYGIKWNEGTLIMDGTNPVISLAGPGCWLNNLTCSASSLVTNEYDLTLKGSLLIEEGRLYLDPNCDTIWVGGNWTNTVGDLGFTETGTRVVFNRSSGHQYIYSNETFNILEVANNAALRFTSGMTVTCAQYDWTSGGIDMNTSATFTALDLVDNAITGNWWLSNSSGIINLSNDDAGEVHLHGAMTISSGTFNVYDNSTYANDSAWGSYGNGSLTMSGGTLDFKTVGILVAVLSPYSLSLNITGGTIRTVGNVECFYSGFAPSGGTLEMYGSNTKYLNMSSGTLYNLKINKAAGVYLYTSASCAGNFTIGSGTFDTEGSTFSCNNLYVYGLLVLDSHMTALGNCYWYGGCTTNIATGATLSTPGNWYTYTSSNPIFPVGSELYFYGTSARTIQNYSSSATYGSLNIGEDRFGTTYSGGVYSISSASDVDLNVPGALTIRTGNTLDLNPIGMSVGDDLSIWGTLMVDSGNVVVDNNGNVSGGALQIDTGSVTINGSFNFNPDGSININSGIFALPNYSLGIPSGAAVTLVSGTIRCGTLTVYGTFQPAGGTVVFSSNIASTYQVYLAPGNWLPNLTIDSNRTYHLSSDITIKGDFTLDFGALDVQHVSGSPVYNIYIAGNWWNNQGPSNFIERTGRVVFNGGGFQAIKTSESFNIIEVNKVPSGGGGDALRIESGYAELNITVTCNQYDWTAGALDANLRGTFTALDLADNGLYGDYTCNSGCVMNLTNAEYVDLQGEMHVFGGEVNIFSDSTTRLYSYWPASASAWIEISGGSLNFRNKGIWLQNGYALAENISGGIISMAGNFVGRRDNFNPVGGSFAMFGDADTTIDFDFTTSSFYDLLIDKSAGSAQVELISGAAIPLICRRNFTINRGNFYMNREVLQCNGDLNINDGGRMSFASYNDVKLAANKTLNVNNGGMIDVYASTADQTTKFSHINDGYFHFNVNAGGHLAANYVLFEYLNSNGVYIKPGAVVGGLNNCTFQNGVAAGVLFRVDSAQNFTVTNANFPTNAGPGARNVWKSVDEGVVYFTGYTGVFSGGTFEDDAYQRVFWTGTNKDLQITSVAFNRPDGYVCAPLTVEVTVANTGTNDIPGDIKVDFFPNQASAPPEGETEISQNMVNLDAGQSKVLTFTNLSTDMVETWTSWARVDTDAAILETNETNNLWGPGSIEWEALPAVEISSIELLTIPYPNFVRVSWTYPVSVSRYRIYNSNDPYGFVDSTTTTSTSTTYNAGDDPYHFFRVTAERDLP